MELQEALLRTFRQKASTSKGRLPAIRKLATAYEVSPLTMHRVLQKLALQGTVYAIPHKGYYWGQQPAAVLPPALAVPQDRTEEIVQRILLSFRQGDFNPFHPLPLQKELCRRLGTSAHILSKALHELRARSILDQKGHSWFLRTNVKRSDSSHTALLVQRCDRYGNLILETDRELEFLKAAYHETNKIRITLLLLGWYESKKDSRLLDRFGNAVTLDTRNPPFLGVIVSTWLMQSFGDLLRQLRPCGQPIAIWWEHNQNLIPRIRSKSSPIAFFNLAFGKNPGRAVAQSLLGRDFQTVWFLSPFHGSEWSQNRWQGVVEVLGKNHITYKLLADSTHASPFEFYQQNGNSRGSIELRRMVYRLLESAPELCDQDAIVCVNDNIAEIARQYLQSKGFSPYLIGFDNSNLSYALQIDSFAFNTEGMVQNMIHHILRPSQHLFDHFTSQEISGRVVAK